MATLLQVEEFRTAQASLVALMQEQLRDVLAAFGPGSDPRRVRDFLLSVFPEFMTTFGDTAAVLGVDFYDMVRNVPVSAGSLEAVFAQPAKVKQSEGVLRWAVGSLFADDPDWSAFESLLLGAAQRLVLQPARQSIDLMAQADARSGKVAAVGWSRNVNPSRAKSGKSCDFCIMLAGRGPVYRSEASAGAVVGRGSDRTGLGADGKRLSGGIGGGVRSRGGQELAAEFHDDCNCTTVPTFYRRESRPVNVNGFLRDETVLVPFG